VLEELALALRTQAVKHWRLRSDDAVERLTQALHQLSITQHDTGGLGQAKQSALEEISRLRAVISEPVSPAPVADARRQFNLSRAYANLANILCDMNERYEAVSQGRQAHRTLAHVVETGQHDQTTINALQIEVLSNLSKALRRVGQGNSAREAAAQAERIAKALFARQPTEFHTWYAISLRRLSAAMSDAGEYKAAASKAAKAVQHFSVMAEHDPGEWREDAAKAHRNYAERLVEVRQFEQAAEQAGRALALWTELSAHRAQAYDEELGKAQIVLARAQHALSDPAAKQSIADALDRLSRFATGGADALGVDDTWADAMTQQAIVQLDRAEPAAAESAQAAVMALRRHLARSLFVLARCQLEQDAEAARTSAEEARTLLRSAQETGCSLPCLVTDAEQAWQSSAGQPTVAAAY
jgi:tetratricopeptide (TPR) repeat protein